ncbi:OmpA family protein [Mucilaginibacter sp. CAU 1740]|uniref:OmpA family protein n=1 Tax=Mucilaginibacter sp. CAU 1740 TaxID=3140365 RepID=UPI00325A5A53
MKNKFILTLPFVLFIFFLKQPVLSKPIKGVNHNRAKIHRTMSVDEMIRNIEFDFSKSAIRSKYVDQLTQLASLMSSGNYVLAIRGHADSIGTYVGNWHLSDKRANLVKDFLIKNGVDAEKITTTPFGSTIPIASNKTAAGRQKNRRAEFKIENIKQADK